MRARGKETKEHEDSLLTSEFRAFPACFLVVTGPAAPVSAGMDPLTVVWHWEFCPQLGQGWHRLLTVPRPCLVLAALPCSSPVNVLLLIFFGQSVSPGVSPMSSCISLFPIADGCGEELHFGQLLFPELSIPSLYQLLFCQATTSHSERNT